MANSLSNLADNFAEGFHNSKCPDWHCLFLEYENINGNLMNYKRLFWGKIIHKRFMKIWKIDSKIYFCYKKFSDDINNFTLLLKKCVYPYEFINDWKKFNKTSLLEKEEFYSNLNMKDSDSD